MRSFLFHVPGGAAPFELLGNTIEDAIVSNLNLVARTYGLGNAAGVSIKEISVSYNPDILGGKGGWEAVITHQGLDLAHRPAGEPAKTSRIWVYGEVSSQKRA